MGTRVRSIVLAFFLLVSLVGGPVASASPAPDVGAQQASAQQAIDPLAVALAHIQGRAVSLGLTAADVANLIVTDQYVSQHTGVTHIYMRQQYEGIEVLQANLNINIMPDGSILSMNQSFVPNLAAAITNKRPDLNSIQAAESAAEDRGLEEPGDLAIVEEIGGDAQEVVLSEGGISQEPIPARLVYEVLGPGDVRLAWMVEILQPDGNHWWNLRVDAVTGEVLGENDYITHAAPEYEVFEMPKESPSDGPRTVVIDPAAAAPNASPFGWHDTNGIPGPEFTFTRGNNVHAYTDTDANNVPDPGSEPDGGADLHFNFSLDLNLGPETYRDAAVANLFYWNNIIHDVYYQYGFDEPSGNFQVNNYGNGGLGGDDVRAEAQDGSGLNNANFGTPPDGQRPRMQMFVWTGSTVTFTVNSPPAIAGEYPVGTAAFGPATFQITGDVVLGLDPSDGAGASTTDACSPLTNGVDVAGNIALVDRGSCNFTVKVKNAQDAGAIAVIVADNAPGAAAGMGGTDASITIPSMRITQADGNLIKANLPGVNVTLESLVNTPRDSDLDAGVIIHEYAHGISNRLTGGPSNVGCLNNQEQMGEGWSDWLALVMTTDPLDTGATARGIGTYLLFQPSTGNGIRPTPYSTDTSINPTTYGDIPGLAVPHGVGYAWATMLWDMYWNLVDKHGYDADLYKADMTAGNQLAIQLVMDGMKIQPCSPGFVDGRNAILQADVALTGGANKCEIWAAFAGRGLGAGASQGSPFSSFDGVENFDTIFACGGPPDTTAPGGVSILINGGAGVTPSPNVTLSLAASDISGVARYRLAETQAGLDAAADVAIDPAQITWNASAPFTLTGGDGPGKQVWLRACDTEDNCADASDTIDQDAQAAVNSTAIVIPSVEGAATPYPSTINVAGRVGMISNVTVSLWNVTHSWPGEIDILLVGPTGQTLFMLSDPGRGTDIVNSDFTFDDAAASFVPCNDVLIPSGTYKPTNCDDSGDGSNDIMPGPAPAGPYGTAFAAFLGTDPNGDWELYVRDDMDGDGGQIAGGWSISIETEFVDDSYQGCLYAGTFTHVSLLPSGQLPTVTCVRGIAISLYEGSDYWACLYAGALTQVSTVETANCGRGVRIGLHAGTDIWACLYAGSLSQVGTSQPTNCGRGAPIGFVRVN